MPDPITTVVGEPVDQTHASDAGHTTSEHFFTKVLMICGLAISVAGFLTDLISSMTGLLPGASPVLRYAEIIGTVLAAISTTAYTVSRTLVKMKLVDAATAAAEIPPKGDAAATVLGADAPTGSKP